MSIKIIPTGAALGAEISGVDLSQPLDNTTFAAIERGLQRPRCHLLPGSAYHPGPTGRLHSSFWRNRIRHLRRTLEHSGQSRNRGGFQRHRGDGQPIGIRRAGEHWHSDMCYSARPPRGTILYAIEVPQLCGLPLGDTEFASAAAAWDALPAPMRRRIDGRHAIFDFSARKRALTLTQAEIDRYPPVRHPIVRTHPYIARKCLYVMRDDCVGIDGMAAEEADALIAALADHIVNPAFTYRHQRLGTWLISSLRSPSGSLFSLF
jgi:taurine dioxygenase